MTTELSSLAPPPAHLPPLRRAWLVLAAALLSAFPGIGGRFSAMTPAA
ncbi:hypothetical protein ACWGR4_17600 [Embleya sp. NPDC055664]